MIKRILASLLSAVLLLPLLAGCSKGIIKEADGTVIADDVIDLGIRRNVDILIESSAFITDYNDNTLTEDMEDGFNCNVTMSTLPAGNDGIAKLQLMANAGNSSFDIISYPLPAALLYQFGSGGTFVPLNDYLSNPNITPYFNAIESEDDRANMLAAGSAADGNIYSMTKFQPDQWNMVPYRMYMNTTWLENLGLSMPQNTDELRDVLQAFHDMDPNGNGRQDEIPLFTTYIDDGNFGCNVILPVINFFTYVPMKMSALTVDASGKNVVAPQVSEGWKEAMRYLHSLYEVGAILPNGSFVYGKDGMEFSATLNYQGNGTGPAPYGKSVNVVGFFSVGSNGRVFQGSGEDENQNFLEYRLMPVLESENCRGYSPYQAYNAEPFWCVTNSAEEPAFCALLGDYFYDPQVSISARFGERKEDWTDDQKFCDDWYEKETFMLKKHGGYNEENDNGPYTYVTGINGQDVWVHNNNRFWHNAQPRYAPLSSEKGHGRWMSDEDLVRRKNYYGATIKETAMEYYFYEHPDFDLPLLPYTEEEQEKIKDTQILYPDAILEWTMKFITGEIDVDEDWDMYVDALQLLGLETYVQCTQNAYERTLYYHVNFE